MRAGVTVSPEANLAFGRFWALSLAIIDTMSSRAGRLPGCGSGTGVVAAASPMILISLFFSVVHAGRDLVANRHGTLSISKGQMLILSFQPWPRPQSSGRA